MSSTFDHQIKAEVKIYPQALIFLKIYPHPLCLSEIIYPKSFKNGTIYPLSLAFFDKLSQTYSLPIYLGERSYITKTTQREGVSQMLMFVDMGGGGVDEKITDQVDMRSGLKKVGSFCFKNGIHLIFSSKICICE